MAKTDPFAEYTRATEDIKPRLIWSAYGEAGSGKTHFALGAPGPIVVYSFDFGLESVIEKYAGEKEIYVKEYEWVNAPQGEITQEFAIEQRDAFIEDYKRAVKIARTVIIDRETDLYDMFKYAEHGPTKEGTPKDWGALKARLNKIVNIAKASDVNLGLLQGMRNEWISNVNQNTGRKGITQSGRRIRAGMDEIESLTHIDLFHHYDKATKTYTIDIGKSRGPGGFDVQGSSVDNLDFKTFAQMVFTDTTEGDWQ